MAMREIIRIDEDLCDGCGQCVTACAEGALKIIDGKARLVREDYCDGLGACLGECPVGALTIERREAPDFEEPHAPPATPPGGCPGSRAFEFSPSPRSAAVAADEAAHSALNAWPIQLHLIRPEAPQFAGAEVLIAASCTAFAMGGFHGDLLAGRGLIIACPKLDRPEGYREKLLALFRDARPASVTVARMEVPCCSGLTRLVVEARDGAGSSLAVSEVVLGLQGQIVRETRLTPGRDRA